jgi:hypothetical protein
MWEEGLMARASKTPQRPAPAAKPAAKSAASVAPAPAIKHAPASRESSLRVTLMILLLAAVTGFAPAALAGQALGYWALPLTAPALPFLGASYDPPLAKPQAMVVNTTATIVSAPGSSPTLATLEPGFPVSVTQYASQGGSRWAKVHWGGPTKAAGGSGWTQAGALQAPGPHAAKAIGDLAALSPAVGRAASRAGSGFAASLFFPASGYAYHSASASQTVTLGQQIIPIALVVDYGEGLAARQPSSINQDLVSGNPEALSFVYHAAGAESGMAGYMANYHISGFHFATDPTQSTATVQALGQFYAALTQAPLVGPDDLRQIFALLAGAIGNLSSYASASQIGTGALTITTAKTSAGYTTIITGQLQPASGPTLVLVAVSANQPTAAASQSALKSFLTPLFATLG